MIEPATMTTYKYGDGEDVGDFAWVNSLEYFEDSGEYFEVIEEVWGLISTRVLVMGATQRWCNECDEDVTLDKPVDGPAFCPLHAPQPSTEEEANG